MKAVDYTANAMPTDRTTIAAMVWTGTGSIGDTVLILDANTSNIIWAATAPTASYYLSFTPHWGIDALQGYSVTLSSGRLIVYYND